MHHPPRLSIIVPTLNESAHISTLIEQLASQTLAAECELIIADGGSSDDTLAQAILAAKLHDIGCITLTGRRGRGAQMNQGAQIARSPELLFLHADCELRRPSMLADALATMEEAREKWGPQVAGHFSLRFARSDSKPAMSYHFFEAKSALNRLECINGDQGMWFSSAYFAQLGMFDTSLEYMEDARLARRVFKQGRWVTLPGCLITSARRFESEGFLVRQMLNAILRSCDAVGLHEFLQRAPLAYRAQSDSARLELVPFMFLLGQILDEQGWRKALVYLQRASQFLTAQAWQVAFWWDCWRSFNRAARRAPANALEFYDLRIAPIVIHRASVALVSVMLIFAWIIVDLIRVIRK